MNFNDIELIEALKRARDINRENDRLSETYNGHFAFVKSYKDAIEAYNQYGILEHKFPSCKQRNEIIAYVKKYGNEVMRDTKAPRRDKVALRILSISFQLYRICWIIYRRYMMGGKKYDT